MELFNTDKELLAFRETRGQKDEVFIRLSDAGRKQYAINYGIDEISDSAIEFIVTNVDDMYDLLNLRFLNPRISNIIDKEISNIYHKLRRKIISYPETGILIDTEVKDFVD